MKRIYFLLMMMLFMLSSCTKEEETTIITTNVEAISASLSASLEGKSLAVIRTYLGNELWHEYFDPEHEITTDFIIINQQVYLNLEYLLSYEIKLFNADPPIYQVSLYFYAL
ncbi:MAG: hypothetical protein AB9842_08345 [Bacteroidales bacterium]